MHPLIPFGIISIIFGILIFIRPELLAYLVGALLIILGVLALFGGIRSIRW
jgi:uncharacterized membrane protein HdeD (DUF308 family)